jgi:acyl-CoA dehydrogenase
VLDGEKTWISNGGIADFYVLFARTGEAPGARGISAFIVEADTPGFEVAERIDVMAPAPAGPVALGQLPLARQTRWWAKRVRVSKLPCARSMCSAPRWPPPRWAWPAARWTRPCNAPPPARCSVACWPTFSSRRPSWRRWPPPSTAPRLLTYRAAWLRDQGHTVTREAAMAKMTATENAQTVIDAALQMWGGMGVVSGVPVERLYREIRALRIYEGATEVQQLIIAREMLKEMALPLDG